MSNSDAIRAGGAAVELRMDDAGFRESLHRDGDAFEKLKDKFGRGSELFHFAHILEGGGALIGLRLLSNLFKEVAEHTSEWKEQLDSGAKSAGDVAEELWQSLPVLGSVRQAGLAIRDVFTGEATAIRETTEQAERLNAAMEAHERVVKRSEEAYHRISEIVHGLSAEGTMIGATGQWKEFLDLQIKLAAKLKEVSNAAKEASDKIASEAYVPGKDKDGKPAKIPAAERLRQIQGESARYNAELTPEQLGKLEARRHELASKKSGDFQSEQEYNQTQATIAQIDSQIKHEEELAEKRRELGREAVRVNDSIKASAKGQGDVSAAAAEATNTAWMNFFRSGKVIAGEFFSKIGEGWDKYKEQISSVDEAIDSFFSDIEEKSAAAGKAIHDENLTPMEKFTEKMKELDRLLASGDITPLDYTRAKGAAGVDLTKQLTQEQIDASRNAGAQSFSSGTFNPNAIFGLGGAGGPQERTAKAAERMEAQVQIIARKLWGASVAAGTAGIGWL